MLAGGFDKVCAYAVTTHAAQATANKDAKQFEHAALFCECCHAADVFA